MTNKRKNIEAKIRDTLSALDPSGINAKKYQDMFNSMDDKQFAKWMDAFLANEQSNFRVDIEEFGDNSRKIQYDKVEAAAKVLGIKIFEYVYMPFASSNPDHPIRTNRPVLVGYLTFKRTQQLVSKKTGLALSDTERDDLTGAAKGESKAGTTTGIENELLAGVGGDTVISELCGARGDNLTEYDAVLSSINEHGSVKLADVKTNAYDKPTLLLADMYFKAMGLKTDIVSPSYYSVNKVRKAMGSAE